MAEILMTVAEVPEVSGPSTFGLLDRFGNVASLAYAAALEALGHRVSWVEWQDLDLSSGSEPAHARRLFVRTPCAMPSGDLATVAPSPPGQLAVPAPGRWRNQVPLDRFDLVFLHKMEGFYDDLCRFRRMVQVFESSCRHVVNDPATIRANLDKHYLIDLAAAGVPTVPTEPFDAREARQRLRLGERLVVKPRFGQRATGVEPLSDLEALSRWLAARAAEGARPEAADKARRDLADTWLVQPYMPGIACGERSLVFVRHDFLHAVCKRPRPVGEGEPPAFLCNAVAGGLVVQHQPESAELAVARAALQSWEERIGRVAFSRIDLVTSPDGPRVMEAEVLNPGLFHHETGGPRHTANRLAAYFDDLLAS